MRIRRSLNIFIIAVLCVLLVVPQTAAGGATATVVFKAKIIQLPTAFFTANITQGTAPLAVNFTDLSTGTPTSWLWEFGDGTNSTEQNPIHTYSSGAFTVNLTAANGVGTSTNVSKSYITVFASNKTQAYTAPQGLTGTTSIALNTSDFTSSGGTQTVSGNTLTLTYPAGSAFSQMTINLDSVNDSGGNISGSINSVTLESTPISSTLSSTGESEKHSLKIELDSLPPAGTEIQTSTINGADSASEDKFTTFALSNGLSILDTKYELVVSHNLPSSLIRSADITMEVPVSWYNTYGSTAVRIMRIDSAGSVSILDTTFSGFDGSNAVYIAHSPYGLSTFGITASQGSTGSQSQSSQGTGGFSSSGGSSARSAIIEPVLQQPVQQNPQVQKPEQGSPRGQLAPAQGSLVSQTVDLSPYSRFIYSDSSGQRYAVIDRKDAELSGTTISVSGKTVEIISRAFTLSLTAGTVTETNGVIKADNIQSILLATTPIDAGVEGVGPVSSSFTTGLASVQSDAFFTTTLAEPVNPFVVEAFRSAAANNGEELEAIAYTLTVQKTNIAETLPTTIKMSVPAEWVTTHGGINSIGIGRIGDDQAATILKTSFSGYDKSGNMEFVADSPHGLSVFGLIATKGPFQAQPGRSGFMAVILQNPYIPVVLIIFGIVVITGCIVWRKRIIRLLRSSGNEHN